MNLATQDVQIFAVFGEVVAESMVMARWQAEQLLWDASRGVDIRFLFPPMTTGQTRITSARIKPFYFETEEELK